MVTGVVVRVCQHLCLGDHLDESGNGQLETLRYHPLVCTCMYALVVMLVVVVGGGATA